MHHKNESEISNNEEVNFEYSDIANGSVEIRGAWEKSSLTTPIASGTLTCGHLAIDYPEPLTGADYIMCFSARGW